MENVIKTNIYITDMSKFSEINEIYKEYFIDNFPARTCIGVASLPKGVAIEIDVIVCKNSD